MDSRYPNPFSKAPDWTGRARPPNSGTAGPRILSETMLTERGFARRPEAPTRRGKGRNDGSYPTEQPWQRRAEGQHGTRAGQGFKEPRPPSIVTQTNRNQHCVGNGPAAFGHHQQIGPHAKVTTTMFIGSAPDPFPRAARDQPDRHDDTGRQGTPHHGTAQRPHNGRPSHYNSGHHGNGSRRQLQEASRREAPPARNLEHQPTERRRPQPVLKGPRLDWPRAPSQLWHSGAAHSIRDYAHRARFCPTPGGAY
eukprot:gene2135-biopygen9069